MLQIGLDLDTTHQGTTSAEIRCMSMYGTHGLQGRISGVWAVGVPDTALFQGAGHITATLSYRDSRGWRSIPEKI
jgi:hypothetical protein